MSGDAFLVVAFLLGYLLGSIPFGVVLTKLAGTEDLRTIGEPMSSRLAKEEHASSRQRSE